MWAGIWAYQRNWHAMTRSWIDLLIVPATHEGESSKSSTVTPQAVSLLLDGRLDEYARVTEHSNLPKPGADPSSDDQTGADTFIGALLLLREGRSEAMPAFQRLIEVGAPDLRLAAAVLTSIVYAGSGRPDLALNVLDERESDATTSTERAFLQIHRGMRAADIGRFDVALSATRAAVDAVKERRDEVGRTLYIVGRSNETEFAWLAEGKVVSRFPPSWRSRILSRIAALSMTGLDQYLDDSFNAFFENPYVRTITFRQHDTTDASLTSALFRADVLGYRFGIRRSMKSLGEYRLLTAAGGGDVGAIVTGLAMLQRASDHNALKRALQVFRGTGPLEPLRHLGHALVEAPWLSLEMRSTFEVLVGTAALFDVEHADTAFDRLLADLETFLTARFGGAYVADQTLDTLTILMRLVGDDRFAEASKRLRTIAEQVPSPLVHQPLANVVARMDWRRVKETEKAAWADYVTRYVGAADDRIFVARAAAAQLLHLDAVRESVLSAYRETQSSWLTPLLLDMDDLGSDDATVIADAIAAAARAVREHAMEGQFGLGGVSTGRLLGRSVARFQRPSDARELREFLTQPAVPVDERLAAVYVLLDNRINVPNVVAEALSHGLPLPTTEIPFFRASTDLVAANLRLRAQFGTIDAVEALAAVVQLASSRDTDTRREVAPVVSTMAPQLGAPVVATLLLTLSHDDVPIVRGAAAHALGSIAFAELSLEASRVSRLLELATERGDIVPRSVWRGLADGQAAHQPVPEPLLRLATQVQTAHVSQPVRLAASLVASRT